MSCGRRSRDSDDNDVIILGSESSSSSDGFPNISVRTPTAGSVGHGRSKVDSKTSSFPRSRPDDRVHAHTPEVKTLYRKPLSTTSSGKRTPGNSKLRPLKSPSTPDPLVSSLFPAQGSSKTTPCATPNPGKSSQGLGCNAVPSSSKARTSTGESRAKKVIPFMDARKEAKRKKSVCSGKPSLVSPGGVESVKHHNKHSQPRQLSDGGENGVEKGGTVRRRQFLSPDGSSSSLGSGGQDQAVKSSGSTGTVRRRQFLSHDGSSSSAGSGGQDQAVKSSGSTGTVRRRQFLSHDGSSSSAGSGGQDQAVKSSGSTGTVRRRQFLSPDGSSSSADSGGQDQAVKSSGPQRKVRRYSLGSTESQQMRNVSTKAKNLVTSASGTSHRTANSHSTSEVVRTVEKGSQGFSGQHLTKGKTLASDVCCVPEPPTSMPDDLLSMDTSDPSDTPTSPAPSLTSGGRRESGVKPAGNNPTPPGHVVCAQLLMAHSMVKEDKQGKRRSPTVVARPKHQHRSSDRGKGRDSRVDRKIKTKAHFSNTPTPSSSRAAKQGVNKPEHTTSTAKASTTTAAALKTKANPTPSPTASSSHSGSSTPLPTARSKPSSHSRMPAPSTSKASTGEATIALPKDKESETETSSMFDFNETDLFEVVDSVETDSVYSAYNQSDTESMNTESYSSRPTSESDHFTSTLPSNLIKSVRCQLPTDSRVGDLPPSVVAKKKRRQVAKKSTTRNGVKYYKHPTKGYLLSVKRHCTVNVKRSWVYVQKRVKKEVSMQQSKKMAKHLAAKPTTNPILPSAPNKPPASTASRVELKKKRESVSEDSMTTCTSAKRPKLSSDALASKQVKPPALVTVLKEPTLLPQQKSCDGGNKVASTTSFEKNTRVGDTSPALATSSTSHTQREQPSPKQRTPTGSQDTKGGNVPLTLSTSTPSTSHIQSKQLSSKQGTVAGSRNGNNQQRSLTPSTPATSHTHSKQASSQHSTTAGSRNKNAQISQQQHTVTSTPSTPISHSQNSVTQRAADGSRNKDLQQRFLPVSTPSASHPSSRPSQGSAARSQQHGNVQQKQVSSSRPKEIPKSKEAALPVQKDRQLSKTVQKDGQLPKSVQKDCQLPKSVQKDCQLPKSVQKDCQLPKSVEKGSQLSKSVQTEDGCVPKSREAALQKDGQLSKSVQKDGYLPNQKDGRLPKQTTTHVSLPQKKRPLLPKPALLQARPLPILVSKSTSISPSLLASKTAPSFILRSPALLAPKSTSTMSSPPLPPSKTSSTVGPPSLPPSKTSSTVGPPSLPPSKTSSTVGPPSLPPSKTSSTVGPPSLPPSKTSSTLRTAKTVGEFLSDLHVFLGKNSDISSSQSENKHESGLPPVEHEHNKKVQLAGNRTNQAASAVAGAGEKAQPSLLDTEPNRSAGTPGAGEKQGADVPQPQILSQTSRGVVHMSPEKTPASLEPVTPVGRKCLSLKRTRLSKTPSFSDSTSEICRSPPLSPIGPGSGSLALLGGVSALGTADAAQKRGGNIVRIASHMQMKPHTHVAPRPRGGKVMPVMSDSQSSQTEDSDGEALETEEIQLATCVGSNSGDARKSTQNDTRKEESSVAQSEADRREQSIVAQSDADRREQSSVAQSDADRREQSSVARLSQQDQAYDLRLLETIAKLAPQETAPSVERSSAHTRYIPLECCPVICGGNVCIHIMYSTYKYVYTC